MAGAITDVPGITVGHYTDRQAATGCTVILCPEGLSAGVDVRGSAPGTRETDPLRPLSWVGMAHAILLSGGSAFGLEAAGGVMRFLEEQGVGFDTRVARVPIVPAAVIFDLGIGDAHVRPGPSEGYQACLNANTDVAEGSVGAGTGATVGKALGKEWATKGGVGTASRRMGNGAVVGALVVVNAYGDVVDPQRGTLLAGPRRGKRFVNSTAVLQKRGTWQPAPAMSEQPPVADSSRPASGVHDRTHGTERNGGPANTAIGVVATSARLDREGVNKLAQMAHDGLARAIRPCHTLVDGDVMFALAAGRRGRLADITALGAVAVEVVAEAVVRGVRQAEGLAGIPSAAEFKAALKSRR
ncbi:MAG: P1 family peptidase [Chloroflexi bacterium]|nr:P1 family peptidase [Chloroflexota bacterium]